MLYETEGKFHPFPIIQARAQFAHRSCLTSSLEEIGTGAAVVLGPEPP